MHNLHTVYNTVNDSPHSTLHLILACLAFIVVVSCSIAIYLGKGRKARIKLNTGMKVNPFLAFLVPVTFFFLVYASIQIMDINVYYHDKAILTSSEFKTVEGPVTNYSPMSKEGHGLESFTVKGVEFHYSYWEDGRSGYHQAAMYGGVIKPNLYVRIGYYYDGDRNAILKLETE